MIKRLMSPATAGNYLLFNLQLQLYNDFYCRGSAAPRKQGIMSALSTDGALFIEELSAANSSRGYWEEGWEVRAFEDDTIVVYREGLELWARMEDCLFPHGNTIAPKMQVSVRFPKDLLGISPGFYMMLSNKEFSYDSRQSLVRLYWNLKADGAAHFVQTVTSMLNQACLPFKLKVLNDPAQYTRCDAGVLYINKSDYSIVAEIVRGIYSEVVRGLKPGTPVFTKPLALGLGLAEDPAQGEGSFGLHRCRLLAEGMIRAYEQGKKSIDERLQAVIDRFAEEAISLEKPFLNPGSCDNYEFSSLVQGRSQIPSGSVSPPSENINTDVFLQIANDIGQRLSREAIWYKDRCNWLGAELKTRSSKNVPMSVIYRTLEPDLYSGTSGIALFLAELSTATGDVGAGRTAVGAMRQALRRIQSVPPLNPLGLYSGGIGIVLVAAYLGKILEEEELLKDTAQLLQGIKREYQEGCEFDIISGKAGAIAALVALQVILEEEFLFDFAIQLADELLQMADKSDAGYSWKSVRSPSCHNLTGFSHGTAGVGYALLELFHVIGDRRYREGAEQAFQYERYCFDADARNWPDFREEPVRGKRNKQPLSFMNAWCHGAPGIALSRLRAYEILKDEIYKAEALIALQTTHEMTKSMLHSGVGNFSLCHGLTGNSEVLCYGSQLLGQELVAKSELAFDIANRGIETSATRGFSWPCGTEAGETPGFMLGLAGIGHFYLRLHNPTVPSMLILQRENFLQRVP